MFPSKVTRIATESHSIKSFLDLLKSSTGAEGLGTCFFGRGLPTGLFVCSELAPSFRVVLIHQVHLPEMLWLGGSVIIITGSGDTAYGEDNQVKEEYN